MTLRNGHGVARRAGLGPAGLIHFGDGVGAIGQHHAPHAVNVGGIDRGAIDQDGPARQALVAQVDRAVAIVIFKLVTTDSNLLDVAKVVAGGGAAAGDAVGADSDGVRRQAVGLRPAALHRLIDDIGSGRQVGEAVGPVRRREGGGDRAVVGVAVGIEVDGPAREGDRVVRDAVVVGVVELRAGDHGVLEVQEVEGSQTARGQSGDLFFGHVDVVDQDAGLGPAHLIRFSDGVRALMDDGGPVAVRIGGRDRHAVHSDDPASQAGFARVSFAVAVEVVELVAGDRQINIGVAGLFAVAEDVAAGGASAEDSVSADNDGVSRLAVNLAPAVLEHFIDDVGSRREVVEAVGAVRTGRRGGDVAVVGVGVVIENNGPVRQGFRVVRKVVLIGVKELDAGDGNIVEVEEVKIISAARGDGAGDHAIQDGDGVAHNAGLGPAVLIHFRDGVNAVGEGGAPHAVDVGGIDDMAVDEDAPASQALFALVKRAVAVIVLKFVAAHEGVLNALHVTEVIAGGGAGRDDAVFADDDGVRRLAVNLHPPVHNVFVDEVGAGREIIKAVVAVRVCEGGRESAVVGIDVSVEDDEPTGDGGGVVCDAVVIRVQELGARNRRALEVEEVEGVDAACGDFAGDHAMVNGDVIGNHARLDPARLVHFLNGVLAIGNKETPLTIGVSGIDDVSVNHDAPASQTLIAWVSHAVAVMIEEFVSADQRIGLAFDVAEVITCGRAAGNEAVCTDNDVVRGFAVNLHPAIDHAFINDVGSGRQIVETIRAVRCR